MSGSNRVLISTAPRPISYINICKRLLKEHGEVHMSALGAATGSLVTVVEILKSRGFAVVKNIETKIETTQNSEDNRTRQKPKLEVTMVKSETFEQAYEEDEKIQAAKKQAAAAAKEGNEEADK